MRIESNIYYNPAEGGYRKNITKYNDDGVALENYFNIPLTKEELALINNKDSKVSGDVSEEISGGTNSTDSKNLGIPEDKSEESFAAQDSKIGNNALKMQKGNLEKSYSEMRFAASQLEQLQGFSNIKNAAAAIAEAQGNFNAAWEVYQNDRAILKKAINSKMGTNSARKSAGNSITKLDKEIDKDKIKSLLTAEDKQSYETMLQNEKQAEIQAKQDEEISRYENKAAKKRNKANELKEKVATAKKVYETTIAESDYTNEIVKNAQEDLPVTGKGLQRTVGKYESKEITDALRDWTKADKKARKANEKANAAEKAASNVKQYYDEKAAASKAEITDKTDITTKTEQKPEDGKNKIPNTGTDTTQSVKKAETQTKPATEKVESNNIPKDNSTKKTGTQQKPVSEKVKTDTIPEDKSTKKTETQTKPTAEKVESNNIPKDKSTKKAETTATQQVKKTETQQKPVSEKIKADAIPENKQQNLASLNLIEDGISAAKNDNLSAKELDKVIEKLNKLASDNKANPREVKMAKDLITILEKKKANLNASAKKTSGITPAQQKDLANLRLIEEGIGAARNNNISAQDIDKMINKLGKLIDSVKPNSREAKMAKDLISILEKKKANLNKGAKNSSKPSQSQNATTKLATEKVETDDRKSDKKQSSPKINSTETKPPVKTTKKVENSKTESEYTIKYGDTLRKIVIKHYGFKENESDKIREKIFEVALKNGISNPDFIIAGHKLKL